jgi:hypothetical protein
MRRTLSVVLGVAACCVDPSALRPRTSAAAPTELNPPAKSPDTREGDAVACAGNAMPAHLEYLGWDPSLRHGCRAYTAPAADDYSFGPVDLAACDCAQHPKPPRWLLHNVAEDANSNNREYDKARAIGSQFFSVKDRAALRDLLPSYPQFYEYRFIPDGNGALVFQSVLDKINGVGVPAELRGSYVDAFLMESFVLNQYYAGLPLPDLGGNDVHVNGFFRINDAAQEFDPEFASVCERVDPTTWNCTRWGKTQVGKAKSSLKVGLGISWQDPFGNERLHFVEVVLWQAHDDRNTQSPDRYSGPDDPDNLMQRYVNETEGGSSDAYFIGPNMRHGATTKKLRQALRANAPAIDMSGLLVPGGAWQWVDINVTGLMKSVKWKIKGVPGIDVPRNAFGEEDWSRAQIHGLYVGPEIWGKGRLNWSVKQLNTVRAG